MITNSVLFTRISSYYESDAFIGFTKFDIYTKHIFHVFFMPNQVYLHYEYGIQNIYLMMCHKLLCYYLTQK